MPEGKKKVRIKRASAKRVGRLLRGARREVKDQHEYQPPRRK